MFHNVAKAGLKSNLRDIFMFDILYDILSLYLMKVHPYSHFEECVFITFYLFRRGVRSTADL